MKKIALISGLSLFLFACSQSDVKTQEDANIVESSNSPSIPEKSILEFDSLRAAKLGADPYGMRKYIMAFLKVGPKRASIDSAQAVELQRAHMANIGKMAKEGKLALAGPFYGNGDLRGIYVFAVDNLEEAEKLTATDPAIIAGSLEMELIPWYGSAALMEVNEIHKMISKIKI